MKTILLSAILLVSASSLSASSISAENEYQAPQQREQPQRHGRNGNREEYKQWMEQMRKYKNDFLTRELKLTDEQKEKFLPLYEKMDAEKRQVERDTRHMEHAVREKGDKATDLELEKAADALVELGGKQNEIERRYHAEFKKILTKRQLFNLSDAERKFQKNLMDQRGKQNKK